MKAQQPSGSPKPEESHVSHPPASTSHQSVMIYPDPGRIQKVDPLRGSYKVPLSGIGSQIRGSTFWILPGGLGNSL